MDMTIVQVERWGEHGWRWTARFEDETLPGGRLSEYRTDRDGEGLWHWSDGSWHQGLGHMQFSLDDVGPERIRGEIARKWAITRR